MNKSMLRDEWICDSCRLGRLAVRERLKFSHNQDAPKLVDEIYAMRQTFMTTLANRSGVMGLEPAVSFHLAKWADELETKAKAEDKAATRVVVSSILDCWEKGIPPAI